MAPRSDKGQTHPNHVKLLKLPRKFNAGFLGDYDRRTQLFFNLKNAYDEVCNDSGGEERLSHIQKVLSQKFIFLEFQIEQLEKKIITNPKKASKLLNRWLYSVRMLNSLGKRLGLQRKAKLVSSNLSEYVGKRRKNG